VRTVSHLVDLGVNAGSHRDILVAAAGIAGDDLRDPDARVPVAAESRSGKRLRATSLKADCRPRDFTEFSGSLGLLLRPEAANDNFVVAVSLARAARNPALEELYFFGPHPGNLAFEIGNPDLESEAGLGFDVSVRGRSSRFEGEVTFFRNAISNFVFRNP
jgi:outer membrane receptor protein involved in Fe transport